MSHEIETMFYCNDVPWHGLGTKVAEAPSIADAIVAAGLDWEVDTKPLFTEGGERVSHVATYRKSDNRVLGVVGPQWRPLQNRAAFDFFDPFLASGEAMLETAGSLREGKRIWVLAALNLEPSVIVPRADDTVRKYVLLSNAHDGTLAVKVGFTPVRVVCANTLRMAHEDGASSLLRIRHTKKTVDSLAAVRDVMNTANQRFEATADQYRFLASKDIVEVDLKRYVNMVFAPQRVQEIAAKRGKAMVLASKVIEGEFIEEGEELKSRVFPKVYELFASGRGNQLPGVRGTYWAAYNAITEYLAHERGKDASARLNEAWFGSGAALNLRALKVGSELAMAA